MNSDRLLQRFLRYVRIDTMANDTVDRYPSSDGQLELGRLLVSELHELGFDDARQDEKGIVTAWIPANVDNDVPVIVLNAHLDTSPETSGANVKPQVIQNYGGGDIVLPAKRDQVIRVRDNPELNELGGCTLITTDGTTLLGADDKAGVAIIMETAAFLSEHPDIGHGPVRILFTCDEELGRGVDFVDVQQLNAVACYTLDGPASGHVDVETFSADLATVTIHGINIHPAIAKDRMVNAIRGAARFMEQLPQDSMSPETTDGRQGFLHPYQVDGGVGKVTLKVLLRDFDTPALAAQADLLKRAAARVRDSIPGLRIDVDVRPQYRNLADGLAKEPRAVGYAEEAFKRLGFACQKSIIRGGTDGSRLSELGLPTPNLSSGQHNPHSTLEWACLDEMVQSMRVVTQLVQIWAEQPQNC